MPSRIPNPEIDAAIDVIGDWQRAGKVLKGAFTFASFREAFDFMIEVAEQADVHQHHPTWQNLDNKVTIELTSHDFGGITDLDLEFAALISRIADSRRPSQSP